MAVVLRSRSGKALLFTDDAGNTYMTSVTWMKGLMEGKSPVNFIQLKRLPSKTDKFQVSPVIGREGEEVDALGNEAVAQRKKKEPIKDTSF